MSKQTGGPAFPNKASGCGGSSLDSNGMTLRDYFAAQVMSSLMQGMSPKNFKWSAQRAYHMADAMIAERNE